MATFPFSLLKIFYGPSSVVTRRLEGLSCKMRVMKKCNNFVQNLFFCTNSHSAELELEATDRGNESVSIILTFNLRSNCVERHRYNILKCVRAVCCFSSHMSILLFKNISF